LEKDDILFIDSSHTVRIGGDVNFLILEILPKLKPGVIIHFHDIPIPNEYPKIYYLNPKFRVFWTESYLLQAFLSLNVEFEILMAIGFIMKVHDEEFKHFFPYYNKNENLLISSSFWIRRKIIHG